VLGGVRGGNVHEDILVIGGRDSEVQWEDIYHGMFRMGWFGVLGWMVLADIVSDLGDDLREPPAFHDEMEKRLKMDF
jgi:proteasome maturation protein